MHTLQLQVDDSVFEKFMGLLDLLPKEKISVLERHNIHDISIDEAKQKVQKALNNISSDQGISLDEAFNKVLQS